MTVFIRPLTESDYVPLAQLGNNKKIQDNLRDAFPHPYTLDDAKQFIEHCASEHPTQTFAIVYNNQFVGIIGFLSKSDIYRKTAEIGYWIGEPFWGLGIASSALQLATQYGFNELELVRIQTGVMEHNTSSIRVLEKAGYSFECIFEKSILKNDLILDEYRFSKINPQYK
ncbi:N-acetyltransferase [bacterium]|nr:MAG: N-acetyltransferase [bacterium]